MTARYYGRTFAQFPDVLEAVLVFGAPFQLFIENVREWCSQRGAPVSADAGFAYLTVMHRNGEGCFTNARSVDRAGFYFGVETEYFLGWKREEGGWHVIIGFKEYGPEAGHRLDDSLGELGWQHVLDRQRAPELV